MVRRCTVEGRRTGSATEGGAIDRIRVGRPPVAGSRGVVVTPYIPALALAVFDVWVGSIFVSRHNPVWLSRGKNTGSYT